MIGDTKHIIFIDSLEEGFNVNFSGESLYNDHIKRNIEVYNKPTSYKYYKINSKIEFKEILKYYEHNSGYMVGGVLIHLDMHGDRELKGLILKDNSLIDWSFIVNLFRPININTCNNLYVTMSTCNGRYLYKGINPRLKSPYNCFISASTDVSIKDSYIEFGRLFEKLISDGNLINAYKEMEEIGSSFYYKDSEMSFRDGLKLTLENLFGDQKMAEKMKKEALEQMKEEIGESLEEVEADMIFNYALRSLIEMHSEAFYFSDCE